MSIKIEQGVPFPKQGRSSKYPFHQMEVGESFVAERVVQAYVPLVNKTAAPKRWASRSIGDGKVRVWRVA